MGRVDVALVLAADVSLSMSGERLRLQREGYAAAIRDDDGIVWDAIARGRHKRIAVAYFEWGAHDEQYDVIGWRVISSRADLAKLAVDVANAPRNIGNRTAVAAAIRHAGTLLAIAPDAERSVVDISGDGIENSGGKTGAERDRLVARGATINGLPISPSDSPDVDKFYEACVVGGPDSFMFPVAGVEQIEHALRAKLIIEISGISQPARIVPAAEVECD